MYVPGQFRSACLMSDSKLIKNILARTSVGTSLIINVVEVLFIFFRKLHPSIKLAHKYNHAITVVTLQTQTSFRMLRIAD